MTETRSGSLARAIRRSVTSSLAARLVRIAEQIVLVPFFVSAWGLSTYGEWLGLTSLAALAAMANLGVGFSSAAEIRLALGRGDKAAAGQVFVTSLTISALLAGLVVLLALASLLLFGGYLLGGLSAIGERETASIVAFSIALVIVSFFVASLEAPLQSRFGFDYTNNLLIAFKLAEILAVIGALQFGFGPPVVSGLIASSASLYLATLVWLVRRHFLPLEPYSLFSRASARRLISPALSYFVLSVSFNIVAVQAPRTMVWSLFGAASLAVFSAGVTYMRSIRIFANVIPVGLVVEIGRAYASRNVERSFALFVTATRSGLWLAVALLIAALLLAPWIIPIWTRGRIEPQWGLLAALACWSCAGSLNDALSTSLASLNQPQRLAVFYTAGLLVGLPLAYWLAPAFGLPTIVYGLFFAEILGIVGGILSVKSLFRSLSFPAATILAFPGRAFLKTLAGSLREER